jgi:hypothetical protein
MNSGVFRVAPAQVGDVFHHLKLRRFPLVPRVIAGGTDWHDRHSTGMNRTYHDEEETTGAMGAFGFVATLLASIAAFCIAGTGVFDGPPTTRMVFVEKSKVKSSLASLPTSSPESDLKLSADTEPMRALPIDR